MTLRLGTRSGGHRGLAPGSVQQEHRALNNPMTPGKGDRRHDAVDLDNADRGTGSAAWPGLSTWRPGSIEDNLLHPAIIVFFYPTMPGVLEFSIHEPQADSATLALIL
ncbi:hypothetical protein AB4851_29085 [Burkholderia sp. 22PA0099]|uniref:hypothetical protein n=1 Tax=Burkholderia sp. 22PA0099 TaxID=3237372 RepID=UPI0039C409A5